MIDCFCLFCFYMFELRLLIHEMTFFLSRKRKSQIVATIGTLLDDIHENAFEGQTFIL